VDGSQDDVNTNFRSTEPISAVAIAARAGHDTFNTAARAPGRHRAVRHCATPAAWHQQAIDEVLRAAEDTSGVSVLPVPR
jgi:hypothetical protein